MANSLSFDGTDLAGASYGVTVPRMPLIWVPPAIVDVQKIPQGYHAAQSGNYEPRMLDVPIVVAGTSHSDLQDKLDSLASLLDVELGFKDLSLDQISDRYWRALPVSGLSISHLGPAGAAGSLQFFAGEPALGNSETTQTETINADPFAFNVASAVAVAGTAHAQPVWFIRNSTGGAVNSVQVTNSTTSETVTWTGTLEDGRWLAIATGWKLSSPTLASWRVYKSTAAGADYTALSYSAVMSNYNAGGRFPRLKHGVQNSISIAGLTAGTVTVAYFARYR